MGVGCTKPSFATTRRTASESPSAAKDWSVVATGCCGRPGWAESVITSMIPSPRRRIQRKGAGARRPLQCSSFERMESEVVHSTHATHATHAAHVTHAAAAAGHRLLLLGL